ncbi:hypothetical protein MKX01_032469 [Papaver californicum]|nr:hypothetical protein MKX01_032469 [Papaver californicum]
MEESLQDQNKLPELKLIRNKLKGLSHFSKAYPKILGLLDFFDRRDYYTAHGEIATFIAKTYYYTTTALRQLGSGSDGISSVSVNRNMFETIVRDILLERTDHTLELYEGSGSNWQLSKSGTPGNLGSFEDVLFANNEMQDSPVIVALYPNFHENECTIGLSYVDLSKRVLGLAEFVDDSQFTNVELALVALGCKECLFPLESRKSIEIKSLHDALSRCGVLLSETKKTEFKSRDVAQDLSHLVKDSIEPVRDLLSGLDYASGSLGALLSYAELLADESNYGNFTIQKYNLDSYMRCKQEFSLFGLMNRTCTAGMGKRLLNRWLKQPLLDVAEINYRLDLVQAFVEDTALRQDLRQHLRRILDIERLMHNLEKKRAGLPHIVKLYQSSIRLPYIKSSLERYDGQFSPLIKEKYLDQLEYWIDDNHLNKFVALVETSVDLEQLENGEYMISSGYDLKLCEIKSERDAVEQKIHNLHKETANDLDLPLDKALKLDKGTQFGHVFRITKKEEPKVRKKLATQFIILETRKDGVKFTNSKLKKLGDQYQKVLEEYTSCQKELVARVVQTAATFSEDEGDIVLEGSTHPCVEAQDEVNFIPNDCNLIRGKSWFQIITGPNMGGKSTFIRQVGVNVLMAQVGCFVPYDKAHISVRDCTFARVGAGDCQLRGVSTSMQEMLETASILKGATDRSLIIIDELGRGTSTYDGFGLAWAICEHLVAVTKAPTLFATHFHELTALAHENAYSELSKNPNQGVANYHVSAHIDSASHKLTMLYRVEQGACHQSFGIHVAEFANFPESVVALAREKAAELEDFSPDLIISNHSKEEVEPKRKRGCDPEDMSRGAARARRFLQEFTALPFEQMELKQAFQHISKLRSDLEKDASDSNWLQHFF